MGDAARLRRDAAAIWSAGIEAVRPESLVGRWLAASDAMSGSDGPFDRVAIVGAGKAAGGMAAALEDSLGSAWLDRHRVAGVVSVPEGCGRTLSHVEVRETRPAGANVPTPDVVRATDAMLGMLGSLGPKDLAIALITGGGSALMARPRPGVPLAEKVAVARFLSQAGAGIRELNTVRQAASLVKAGGLARACTAGRLLVLVLSDVIGDPLELIASGPCMPLAPDPGAALAALARHGAIAAQVAPDLVALLESEAPVAARSAATAAPVSRWITPRGCAVEHVLLGSNETAVEAAAGRARALGYDVQLRAATSTSATCAAAESVGGRLAAEGATLVAAAGLDGRPRALVEGGEATVVVPADHGAGGRNQQTVLAAIAAAAGPWPAGLLVASVGSDGEDGPTDAAGAFADADTVGAIAAGGFDVGRALTRCDALPLFAAVGGLVKTGPTGTNVADIRVVLARP